MADLVDAGAAKLDPTTGALLVQCKGSAVSPDGDAPDYGDAPVFSCLGVYAMPYPADENGGAQLIVDDDIAGLDGAVVGGRDTRSAKIVGALKPGDTVVAATGPEMAAQLQLKESKRQSVLVSKDTRGRTIVVSIDGKNDQIMITGFEHAIEVSREQGILLSDGKAGIQIKDGMVSIWGQVVLGGRAPVAPVHMGVGAGPTSVPAPGVFIGA